MDAWTQSVDQWSFWLRAAERATGTVKLRVYHVMTFARSTRTAAPSDVTEHDVIRYLTASDWSASTRRSHRASISQFFRWAITRGLAEHDPTAGLLPIKRTRTLPRPAPDDVILAALHAADTRVRLMLLFACEAGLRRGEIARIHSGDLIGPKGDSSVRVHGKGRKQRVVPLTERLRIELLQAGLSTGWLFPSPRREGPIGAIRVGELVSAALPNPWTCHSLRHRFATTAYRNSRDLLLVQTLLGHSKPETTALYVHVDTSSAREIVERGTIAA
ncbi:tyrosine-type recombinase/integrase [Helcobacillus massiliensis]|uniref:tyrosine-type recombinase/integrase n=2 Tax=Helcobacillus massiliensis TaxID=521392 RepID=UPI003D746B99